MAHSKPDKSLKDLQCAVPCEVCETGDPGQHYCTVCKTTMCNACKIHHGKMSLCKQHKVVLRSQISSADQSQDTCRDHSGHMVAFQCQMCNVLVCTKCVSNKRNGHRIIEIEDIYQNEKIALEKRVNEMEKNSLQSIIEAITSTKQKEEEYKRNISSIKNEMEKELNDLKAEADRIHKERIQQLFEIEASDLSIIDGVVSGLKEQRYKLEKNIAEFKKMIATSNQVGLVILGKSHTNPQVVKDTTIPKLPKFQALDVKQMNVAYLLGKLNTNTADDIPIPRQVVTPKIISSFRTSLEGICCLCMTKDGNAWVSGIGSRTLNLMDINGKVIKSRTIKNRVYCMAIMDNGDIIMNPNGTDSKAVLRLPAVGTEDVVYDASPSFCMGVSVTGDQKILICTNGYKVLMYDGMGRKQIYHGNHSINHAIELPDKSICTSEYGNNQLLLIDKEGRKLNSIVKPLGRTDFSPRGLAVDKINNVLATDFNNDCVYQISPDQVIKEIVGKSHGIKWPYWLSIDKYNNLWIGQGDGSVKILKYLQYTRVGNKRDQGQKQFPL